VKMEGHHDHQPYVRLGAMIVLSFIAMYILMYAMVDAASSVFNNINQVYMAGLMAMPMVGIELALMARMYPSVNTNRILMAMSVVAMVVFFLLIRQQIAVTDTQFLRSMIPHHSGAILMCSKAPVQSAEIKELCRSIIAGQNDEIRQMKALLAKQ
jgi:uncharacterized protein (DUF305 family)